MILLTILNRNKPHIGTKRPIYKGTRKPLCIGTVGLPIDNQSINNQMNDNPCMDYLKDNPIDVATSMVLDKPARRKRKPLDHYGLLFTTKGGRCWYRHYKLSTHI